MDELAQRYPEDTAIHSIWLPVIRAALQLNAGDPEAALKELQTTVNYEAAAEFWPQTLRGRAWLQLGRGAEAAGEFQIMLAQRGQAPLSPLYPLAHLGLARAQALAGESFASQQAWEDFCAAWREADADLPVLVEARQAFKAD
jgi:hypothetical protein